MMKTEARAWCGKEREMASDTRGRMRRIRYLLSFFVVGLVLSGVTAFPIKTEVDSLNTHFGLGSSLGNAWPAVAIETLYLGDHARNQDLLTFERLAGPTGGTHREE